MQEPKRTLLAATGFAAVVFAAVAVSSDGESRIGLVLQAGHSEARTVQSATEVTCPRAESARSRQRADAGFAGSMGVDESLQGDDRHGSLDALPIPCQALPYRISQFDP